MRAMYCLSQRQYRRWYVRCVITSMVDDAIYPTLDANTNRSIMWRRSEEVPGC